MIFYIYEIDFKNKVINNEINNNLLVYDYCYSLLNNEWKKYLVGIIVY